MGSIAKVFMNGRSQAIRLPKDFRVSGSEVRLSKTPGGFLVSEADPWDGFEEACQHLDEGFFTTMDSRDRSTRQKRDFSAGGE